MPSNNNIGDFRIFYVDRRNGFWSTSRCGKKTSSTVKLSYWCTQAEICGLIIWIICYTWLLWSSVSLLPIRLVCLLSLRARRACVWSVLFCLFLFPQVASLVSFIVIECTYDTLSNYLQLVWDLTFLRKYKVVNSSENCKSLLSMVCFIYILDSSNSSSFTFWSRSKWRGIWTSNSNGSWTDKNPSHFTTAKETSVKATFFFIQKPQQTANHAITCEIRLDWLC